MKKIQLLSLLCAAYMAWGCTGGAEDATAVCINGATRDGATVCGLNSGGVLTQACVDGAWVDKVDGCTRPEACLHEGVYDESRGGCTCYPGYEGDICEAEGACNQSNKQKAVYVRYGFSPDPGDVNLFDVSATITWTNINNIDAYGKKGVYEAYTIGTDGGPSGYFGAQIKGNSTKSDMFLFSIWDQNGFLALPMHNNCKRNCNDCNEETSTGTKCNLDYDMFEGESYTLRIQQVSDNGTTGYEGQVYSGAIWRVTALPLGVGTEIVIGEILFQDTTSGLNRFNSFHEHIGCTLCASFYTSVHRTNPVVAKPTATELVSVRGSHNCSSSAECSCDLYRITYEDGVTNIQTGVGVEKNFEMSDTISFAP